MLLKIKNKKYFFNHFPQYWYTIWCYSQKKCGCYKETLAYDIFCCRASLHKAFKNSNYLNFLFFCYICYLNTEHKIVVFGCFLLALLNVWQSQSLLTCALPQAEYIFHSCKQVLIIVNVYYNHSAVVCYLPYKSYLVVMLKPCCIYLLIKTIK